MQKLLKLQHHRHTGRRIAHHHTSYRGLAAVLLACGLTMLMIQKASADSYIVTAKVPVDIPATAATIGDPASGQTYIDPNITINGTCPIVSPAVIVSIWNGPNMLGSSVCANDGTYSIPLTLMNGLNTLIPKTFTVLNDPGPDGPAWLGTYNPPVVPVPPQPSTPSTPESPNTPTPPDTTGGGGESLPGISVSDAFLIYKPFQEVTLVVVIAPSDDPYTLTTNWGDGTVEQTTFNKAGRHELKHIYKKTGTFRLGLKLVDGQGKVTHFVLAAVNLAKPNFVANFKPIPAIGGGLGFYSWAWLLWFSYFIAVAVTFVFWLILRRRQRQYATIPASRGSGLSSASGRQLAGAKNRRKK